LTSAQRWDINDQPVLGLSKDIPSFVEGIVRANLVDQNDFESVSKRYFTLHGGRVRARVTLFDLPKPSYDPEKSYDVARDALSRLERFLSESMTTAASSDADSAAAESVSRRHRITVSLLQGLSQSEDESKATFLAMFAGEINPDQPGPSLFGSLRDTCELYTQILKGLEPTDTSVKTWKNNWPYKRNLKPVKIAEWKGLIQPIDLLLPSLGFDTWNRTLDHIDLAKERVVHSEGRYSLSLFSDDENSWLRLSSLRLHNFAKRRKVLEQNGRGVANRQRLLSFLDNFPKRDPEQSEILSRSLRNAESILRLLLVDTGSAEKSW
jgi:hypothetical protein